MSNAPFSPLISVYELLGTIITARLQGDVNAGDIRATLQRELSTTRHALVRDTSTLSTAWDKLRHHPPTIDFLLDVTNQLSLMLGGTQLPMDTLVEHMAKAMGSYCGGQSVIDDDLKQRLPSDAHLKKLLNDNHWFVTLQLIEHRFAEFFPAARA